MSCVTRFQILRGTTSQRVAMTPLAGEMLFDTELSQIFIGDGITVGGNPLSGETLLTIPVRNNTGSAIEKGKVVYVTGAAGNRATIALADNSADSTADTTIGLTLSSIPDNSDGLVLIEGLLDDVDTSSFSDGDLLYLGENGNIVNVAPVSPKHEIFIGYCLLSNASNGQIFVKIQSFGELADSHDVLINTPSDDQVLTYEASTSLWKNKTPREYFETVSKNLKSWNASIATLPSGDIDTITYTDGVSTIVKTFGYTSGDLTTITLSGDTPNGIDLTKTLTYTGGNLTGITYS